MNERIKQLMDQAGTDTSGKWMGVDHAEKFALLIVRDNIQTLRGNGYDDAAQVLQDIHFGIEDPV